MSITAKTPSREAEGGRYRTRGPSGVFARLAGTPPFESAGSASRRISASLSPGVTVSFIRGAACGCFLGGIGSGSTIGADWLEAAPYDWNPVGSSAMRALPKAAGTRRPKAEPGGSTPASEGHEDESPVCRGANQREGEGSVKNSGDGQSSAESRLGALEARTEILQESVKDLTKKVEYGFERQRKEIKDDLEKQRQETGNLRKEIKDDLEKQRQETGNLRKEIKDDLEKQRQETGSLRREIKDDLEKQRQETGSLRKEIKDDLEKQNKRIDDGFERQSREFNARLDKLLGAVWALVAAILVAVIGAVATDFFAGLF